MDDLPQTSTSIADISSPVISVRLWAAAKAAAGADRVEVEVVGPVPVSTLVDLVVAAHPDRPGLRRVLDVCSVLVGDRPEGDRTALVQTGSQVEFLPPFAGG